MLFAIFELYAKLIIFYFYFVLYSLMFKFNFSFDRFKVFRICQHECPRLVICFHYLDPLVAVCVFGVVSWFLLPDLV